MATISYETATADRIIKHGNDIRGLTWTVLDKNSAAWGFQR